MKQLNNAQVKQAKKTVQDKLTGKTSTKTTQTTTPLSVTSPSIALESITVPGLTAYNPDSFSAMMPQFNPDDYAIENPLQPSEKLPQVTQSQFDKASTIYEGTQRALKLTGMALDTTRERFVTIGKHAKTLSAGIQASTEIEKVKGNYLTYLDEVESTTQKNIQLAVSQYKTQKDTEISAHTKTELDEKLQIAQTNAELAKIKRIEALGKLTEAKKQLGDYLPSSN